MFQLLSAYGTYGASVKLTVRFATAVLLQFACPLQCVVQRPTVMIPSFAAVAMLNVSRRTGKPSRFVDAS